MSKAKIKRLGKRVNPDKRVQIKKSISTNIYQKWYDKGAAEGKARLQKKYDYDKRAWKHAEKENKEYIERLKEETEAYLESLDKIEAIITYGDPEGDVEDVIKVKDLVDLLYEEIDDMHKESLGVKRWVKILEKKIAGLEIAFSVSPEESFFAGDQDDG